MERRRIVVVGSGNVATHLAPALDRENDVVQVVARSLESASRVASLTRNGRACAILSEIEPDADFYIVAVNDDAVEAVAKSMPRVAGIVAHTSGSVPMSALAGASARVGVFYPCRHSRARQRWMLSESLSLSKETPRHVPKSWRHWPARFRVRSNSLIPPGGRYCIWRRFSPAISLTICGIAPTEFWQRPDSPLK